MTRGFQNYISSHPEAVLPALTLAGAVLALICLFLLAQVLLLKRRYAFLLRVEPSKDLGDVFAEHGRWLERLDGGQKELKGLAAALLEGQQKTLQGVGLVRFDAFEDVGGQQSYAVALVDGSGDGVIFSSVYSRNESRTYAKMVRGGRCQQALSSEEQEALELAIRTKPPAAEAVR